MRRAFLAMAAAVSMALAGCGAAPQHDFKQTQFHLTVIPNTDDFLTASTPGVVIEAEAAISDGFCAIRLRKYPQCLQHEIRHCIEGNWHEGDKTNFDDCH